ncbi:MAG: hypothetical protein WKF80_04475 [Thermomicrobiales bacterium]
MRSALPALLIGLLAIAVVASCQVVASTFPGPTPPPTMVVRPGNARNLPVIVSPTVPAAVPATVSAGND